MMPQSMPEAIDHDLPLVHKMPGVGAGAGRQLWHLGGTTDDERRALRRATARRRNRARKTAVHE
jgi:hypothetical protein